MAKWLHEEMDGWRTVVGWMGERLVPGVGGWLDMYVCIMDDG